MKVMFVHTNVNGFHTDTFAFGLAIIVAVTKKAGHDVKTIIVHSKNEYGNLLKEVDDFQPKIIGFTSVSSQFVFVKELAEVIKKSGSNAIIVCGGIHPTIYPQCIKECNALDAVFVGESEESFLEFMDKIEKVEPYHSNDNLAYVRNNEVVVNKLKQLEQNLDKYPFPDKITYDYKETLENGFYAPFKFSRGCPFMCTYCSNHAIAKAYGMDSFVPRFRSVDSSIREIEETIRLFPAIKTIAIVDDIFGQNRDWRRKFCAEYEKRVKLPFFCLLRANVVDDEFVADLKHAGCVRISFGVESGNDYVRNEIMNRKMSKEILIKAFSLARKHSIYTNAINIIGVPGETEEMIWDTIKLNRELRPTVSGVNIFYPYKGTKLGDYCFEHNLVDLELFNRFSNERRETVLKFPEDHCKKLIHFQQNWDSYVYPFRLFPRLKKLFGNSFLWKIGKVLFDKVVLVFPAVRWWIR